MFDKSKTGQAPTLFIKPCKRLVTKVFIHCSASDNPNVDAKEITSWHVKRGFATIGYHYFIKSDGTVEVGRNIEQIPAAQEGNNRGSIAICVNGLTKFNQDQFDSLINLCDDISIAYDHQITFHGHCEVSNKSCPVFDYRNVLNLDNKGYIIYS